MSSVLLIHHLQGKSFGEPMINLQGHVDGVEQITTEV